MRRTTGTSSAKRLSSTARDQSAYLCQRVSACFGDGGLGAVEPYCKDGRDGLCKTQGGPYVKLDLDGGFGGFDALSRGAEKTQEIQLL